MGSSSSMQRSRNSAQQPANVSPSRSAPPTRVHIQPRGGMGVGAGAHLQQPHYLMFSGPPAPYRFNNGGPNIFYVDSQQRQAPPPAVQESAKVKNHANLLKHTLGLVPTGEPHKYSITFHCDTAVETVVQIFFGATEKPDPDTPDCSGAMFVVEFKNLPNCVLPIAEVPAETNYCYTSPAAYPLDIRQHAEILVYNPDRPNVFPVVVALSYQMPSSESSGDDPESGDSMQSQYTYAEVYRTEDDVFRLKCLRQRLQLVDGSLFELEDIYGVVGEDHHEPVASATVVGAAVAAADTLCVEGDECVICLANERDTTVMPCRHMCLCGECAEVLRRQTNKCPICRTVIECLMTLKKD